MGVLCLLNLICVGVFTRSNWSPIQEILQPLPRMTGVERFKRLSFGVNAAPEKYQHIITQTMAGFKVVANMADDLFVHRQDMPDHDRNLMKLLERLEEKNLTPNAEKCTL